MAKQQRTASRRTQKATPSKPTAGKNRGRSGRPGGRTVAETRPATLGTWIAGARLPTLLLAVAAVAVGTGAASEDLAHPFDHWVRALLALVGALALQIAVNFANDYSDGIRGTDKVRVGPVRLVPVPASLLAMAGEGGDRESWFLARRCKASGPVPWFGRIKGIFVHNGPVGAVTVLDVQWHGDVRLDDAVMSVSFLRQPSTTQGCRFWLATDVAPVRVRALAHPTDDGRLVALSDTFSFMMAGGWGTEYVSR